MVTTILLFACAAAAIAAVLRRCVRHRHAVSPAWLVDHERRAWSVGIDQACVRSWPIGK